MIQRLVGASGEPVIRKAMNQAMRILGGQFVLGQTIEEALANAEDEAEQGYRFSFDMLGEAAYTADDAERYSARYLEASRKPSPPGGLAHWRRARASQRGPRSR